MSGCYGKSPEDRHFSNMLHEHLDKQEAEQESFEQLVGRLMEDEYNPYTRRNFEEGIAQTETVYMNVFWSLFVECKNADFKDADVNFMAMIAFRNMVENYWRSLAEREAELILLMGK